MDLWISIMLITSSFMLQKKHIRRCGKKTASDLDDVIPRPVTRFSWCWFPSRSTLPPKPQKDKKNPTPPKTNIEPENDGF